MTADKIYQNASDVRKNWSFTIDTVVHDRPAFINRTRDYVAMLDNQTLLRLLDNVKYHLEMESESDGSVTAYLVELELVENAPTKSECVKNMISAMKDYALDFYNEFNYWSKAPNRAPHVPYVLKILMSNDDALMGDIICQTGKN